MTVNYPKSNKYLVLASASPRRAELLQQICLPFTKTRADIDETIHTNEPIADYAIRMAREKAQCAWQLHGGENVVMLTADTCGEVDGELLNKPESFDDAKRLLRLISGKPHLIYTAFALFDGEQMHVENVSSTVHFRDLSDNDIANYWATGEPHNKSGAYAIQGIGSQFIAHLEGSFSAVMGLPLFELARALPNFDIRTL